MTSCVALAGCMHDARINTWLSSDSSQRGTERVRVPTNTGYDTLLGTSGVVTYIEGIGIAESEISDNASPADPERTRVYLYGYRDTATGELFITDTRTTLHDADGANVDGGRLAYADTDHAAFTEGYSQITYSPASFNRAADYDYARLFDFTTGYGTAGRLVVSSSIAGVSTHPEDMPTGGSASFTGDSYVVYRQENNGVTATSYDRGTSTVVADFTNAQAQATLDVPDLSNLIMTSANMVIEGNGFSGGTVSATMNGEDIATALFGSSVEGTDAAGMFFGPAGGLQPPEVGGYIAMTAENKGLYGYYLAD